MRTLTSMTIFLLFSGALAFAGNQDFSKAAKIDTEHFTVYYQPGVDINKLVAQLSAQTVNTASAQAQLSSILESLFVKTSDILDVHVYSLKTNIKIFASQQDLADLFNNTFHAQMPEGLNCFYLDQDRTIYVSAEYFKQEVLGSEIGRAIMNSYFVVEPSVGIQKILTGYVQYQLHKGPILLN